MSFFKALYANKNTFWASIFSVLIYLFFAYVLKRESSLILLLNYASLFGAFYIIVSNNKKNTSLLFTLSIVFRVLFIVLIPNLSQDFYRFIWDGRMLFNGINPYLHTPDFFIQAKTYPVNQALELYNGMGRLSSGHYTNYPPINQLCFAAAALFSGNSILGSVITLRLLIVLADIGTYYFAKKLLSALHKPHYLIFWYILNPFIIIELTGNLHFEGVMIFFFVWSLYLLYNKKWLLSAILLACSISVKLIPLLFLPLFFKWFVVDSASRKWSIKGFLKLSGYYIIVFLIIGLLFLPFFSSEFITNYAETVGLWFQNFEFNASVYYVCREIGYLFRGYNEIAVIGKILPVTVLVFVTILTFFKKNDTFQTLCNSLLFAFAFYLFTTTTVHPWYIATLLIISVFTRYKFPLVWSFMLIFSYFAYKNDEYSENLWLVALEYVVVYGVLIWELCFKNKSSIVHSFSQ